MDSLPAETLAYIAGFFDGEGSITFKDQWRAEVTQTKARGKAICEWLRDTTGVGRVCLNRPAKGNHSDLWCWYVLGPTAESFLEAIRPYTHIKTEKIDEVLSHNALQQSLL